jgi:hypothetical protein
LTIYFNEGGINKNTEEKTNKEKPAMMDKSQFTKGFLNKALPF